MISIFRPAAALRRIALPGALALGVALGLSSVAGAGECPAGKMGENPLNGAATAPKDVTDTVIGSVDLAKESINAADRQFRLRRLEIKPGGIVPLHSHGDRPAIIYVVSGEITEYASNCMAPIVHKAGDVAPETHVTSHWWKNTGKKTVVLLSADILHDPNDKNM